MSAQPTAIPSTDIPLATPIASAIKAAMVAAAAAALALPGVALAQAPASPARPLFADPLLPLSQVQRDGTLRRAVTENGLRCGRLDQSAYRGFYKNKLSMWVATCTPGGRYAFFIGPDQSVQVRTCADEVSLGLPDCDPRSAAKPAR